MTVGIGAICEADTDDPKVIVAADRLVTSGIAARREYEHTSSKMTALCGSEDGDPCVVVGVGAGSVSLADEVFYKTQGGITNHDVETTRMVAKIAAQSLQQMVKETIERQVLSQYDLDLDSFNERQGKMNPQIVNAIYQDINDKREELLSNVNILLAGVDGHGAHLFNIIQNDMSRHDSIGYLTVGSGAEPARSAFIRNRFDDECSVSEALLEVTEAKEQSEEAQGVGSQMDISVLSGDGKEDLDDDIEELRDIYEEVEEAEKQAREDVMEKNNYTFGS